MTDVPAPTNKAAAKPSRSKDGRAQRRGARLAAVQALYQLDMVETTPQAVIAEFVTHRLEPDTDKALFADVVGGAFDRSVQIDEMIGGSLVEGWTLHRLETVMRAILRAGVYELLGRTDIPARAVISEYVELAHAFFTGREPAMVNGVLDKLAHILRDGEFGKAGSAPAVASVEASGAEAPEGTDEA